MKRCPNCEGPLVMHEGPKAGMGHCNACGVCWDAGDLRDPEDVKPKRTKKAVPTDG